MKIPTNFKSKLLLASLILFFPFFGSSQNFGETTLDFNGFGDANQVTSLMFGPDNRLYTVEYTGLIKIYSIERNDPTGEGNVGDYIVTAKETLNDIQTIQDYNDDGTLFSEAARETTGITVTGTASNPVFYVTSSDIRIGGGFSAIDSGLDTNSGIITRYTWNGISWDIVDIVRGLPRSEENHGTHGLEFATINGEDYLIVCSGGHTNGGAPSKNFTYLPEYALSAAILSINLTQLNNDFPILSDNGRNYIYDLPTLDDPTRANVNGIEDPNTAGYNGIDINDPFGGNDGLNQAKLVEDGPVQIFSPGYRNSYDLVVTQSGAVYATENGANGGWGGFPENEGTGNVTNNYISTEPGSSSPSGGEQINNEDQLHLITTDITSYEFGSLYGGHPNPTRANPNGAGLFTAPANTGLSGSFFRTQLYDPDGSTSNSITDPNFALPADWPPYPNSLANPVEGDWRGPGEPNPDGPVDNTILVWGTNTNGIDEYTASNFGGAMQGDLIAGTNAGVIRRVELNTAGEVENFSPNFISGISGNSLGISCNSDDEIFPGTIWVGNFNSNITILEPLDFVECIEQSNIAYNPLEDYDNDGYTNQDELDNLTDYCNGGSQPFDFDKSLGGSLISNLNDTDDDNDGILDINDPFQLGNFNTSGSDAFILPVINELFSDNQLLFGYLGLGLTGLMNNNDPNDNWLNWIDRRDDINDPNPNDILGGAIGAMTMQMTSGTALGIVNNQEKAFQYGVQTDQTTGLFTVSGVISNFNQPLQLYGNTLSPNGELGFFIGDGTQSNYIKFVATKQGLKIQQEINDVPQTPIDIIIDEINRPSGAILFNFIVNPISGNIDLEYAFDTGNFISAGSIIAQGNILAAIQQSNLDLAVGFIGTSNAVGVELEGTWGALNVTKDQESPIIADALPNQSNIAGEVINPISIIASGGEGALNFNAEGLPPGIIIDSNTGVLSGNIIFSANTNIPYNVDIYINDSDGNSTDTISLSFDWDISPAPSSDHPYIRVNAGGDFITSNDSNINWEQNNTSGIFNGVNHTANSGNVYANGLSSISRHASIPDYIDESTFNSIFGSERWDDSDDPKMEFTFTVPNQLYSINLFLCNSFSGTNNAGDRVFDILIEGNVVRTNLDLISEFGHQTGGMLSFPVTVQDGQLNIEFLHAAADNPLVNGIEIRSFGNVALGTPIAVTTISDQVNNIGDLLDGSFGVLALGGDGNLNYSATGLPSGVNIEPTNGQFGGEILFGAGTYSPYTVTVTIDDSDDINEDAISTQFIWTVDENLDTADDVLYRINAGGELLSTSDSSNVNWEENDTAGAYTSSSYSVNTGNIFANGLTNITRHSSIPNYIDNTTFSNIFATERWNDSNATEMEFTLSVPNEQYEVNIFLCNTFNGTNNIGDRVFDISIEDNIVNANLDIIEEFGHLTGGMLSFPVVVQDGELNIEFLHGAADNPLINAIEIKLFDGTIDEIPVSVDSIVNQFNNIGDTLDGSFAISASGGEGNLNYAAEGLPTGMSINPSNGQFTGQLLAGAEINSPYNVTITVDDADNNQSDAISSQFFWTITDFSTADIIHRINAGGALITSDTSSSNWQENITEGAFSGTNYTVNTGKVLSNNQDNITRHSSIPNYINNSTFNSIFSTERWDENTVPEMEFTIPVTNEQYEVNIFLCNTFNGTNNIGDRVFDISIEGNIVKANLDIIEEFGHLTGGMLSFPVAVQDGELNIEFLHGTADNPLVNAIEIKSFNGTIDTTPISVDTIVNQFNMVGDLLDGSLNVLASGGDSPLTFSATGLPNGVILDPNSGQFSGNIAVDTDLNSPYLVTITVDDSDNNVNDIVSIDFNWSISTPLEHWHDKDENENYTARHECSFVQAGDKFYLMGGRENASTLDIYDYQNDSWSSLINSTPKNFNHFQAITYKGLIWVIGAFQANNFPNEQPEEHIWMFNPANQEWIQGSEIPVGRRRGSAGLVLHNDKFYVLAGNTIGHDGGYVSWFDEYDPATGTWTVLPDAPRARDHFHATVIGGKLYAAGGRLSGGEGGVFKPVIPEVDVYDFNTGTWSTLTNDLPTPRAAPAISNLNNKLQVIGGEVQNELVYGVQTTDALKVVEEFDPLTGAWERLNDMNHDRHGTQAIVSGDGIHILGGSPKLGGGNQKNMEYFGADNPSGTPIIESILTGPNTITLEENVATNIGLNISGGNTGIFIKSMYFTGDQASEITIDFGNISNGLLNPNSTHLLGFSYSGSNSGNIANLVIEYNSNDVVSIPINSINPCSAEYIEENGIVVIETEHIDEISNWNIESSDTGFSGTGYIAQRQGNYFNSPGNELISINIEINNPGIYKLHWRSKIGLGNSTTEHNDSWVRFPDADDNFATPVGSGKNGTRIYPKGSGKTPTPNGSGSNNWWKVYCNALNWNWQTRTSDSDAHQIYAQFDAPGVYTLEISARSEGHLIDRIVLSKSSFSKPKNLSIPENRCMEVSTYTIDAVANIGGSISPAGITTLVEGSDVVYNINPDTGFNITDVIVDGISQGAVSSYTFSNVNQNHTINVTFNSLVNYTVEASANNGGSITPNGTSSVIEGNDITFTINPDAGFNIADVIVDGNSQGAIDTYTFSNVTQNHTISASFNAVPTFTVDATANSGGSISPDGLSTITQGDNITYNITPDTGFTIADVIVDGDSQGAIDTYTFSNVTQNHTISASFNAVPTFTVDATANSGGSISPDGLSTITQGDNITYNITPDTGFTIADVIVDGNSQGAIDTYTFSNVTQNHTISASFNAVPTFTIIATANSGGTISPNGSSTITQGDGITYTISPDAGFTITDVIVNGSSQGAITTYSFNNVSQNNTIEASFEQLPQQIVFTLINAGNNSDIQQITNNSTILYNANTQYNIRANGLNLASIGSIGFNLSGPVNNTRTESVAPYALFGDANGNYYGNELPIGNYTLTASAYSGAGLSGSILATEVIDFSVVNNLTSFNINAIANSGGSITPNGTSSVIEGNDITFTINPDAGFNIADVIVDGNSQGAIDTYTFSNVTQNHTISASFNAVPTFTVDATANSGGSISPDGLSTITQGDNITYNITPDTGFTIADVIVDGDSQGAIDTYTFSNVTQNHTISASFNAVPTFTVDATANSGGSISPDGLSTITQGDNITYNITPDTGFTIADVIVDGNSQGAIDTYTFSNVTQNHTISASFNAVPTFTIIATANSGGTISPNGSSTITQGDGITYTISPDAGFTITDVIVNGSSQGAITTYSFNNVSQNNTIEASFEQLPQQIVFTLINAGNNSDIQQITNNSTILYNANTQYNIRANGLNLASIGSIGFNLSGPVNNTRTESVAPYALFGDANGNYYGNELPIGNYTLTASAYSGAGLSGSILATEVIDFSVVNNLTSFNINAIANSGGSITPNGTSSVIEGNDITFTINPDAGFNIADVIVDGNSQGAIDTYTFSNVTQNHTISASFNAVPTFTVDATANSGGSISPDGLSTITQGDNITYNITPDTGFTIADVIVDGDSQGAIDTYTFSNVTQNHTISASFNAVPTFTVDATANSGGSISPDGLSTITQGDNITYNITPDTGFTIADVIVDGNSQGAIDTYTFSNVTQNHTISASFNAVPTFTIIATANSGGTISPNGSSTITQGDGITYTISPDAGFTITDVIVNGSSQGAITTYSFNNVSQNNTIEASFEQLPQQIVFTLINAGNNSDIQQITNNSTILYNANTQYNIRANGLNLASIGSIGFNLSGPVNNTRTESVAPYALFGDANGNYYGNELPIGNYTLTASAYSGAGLSGSILATEVIDFSVLNNNNVVAKLVNNDTYILNTETNNNISALEILLFPNPASNEVSIKIPETIRFSSIEIYDTRGRLLKSYDHKTKRSTNTVFKFNISDFQNGLYIINIQETDKLTSIQKRLIVRN